VQLRHQNGQIHTVPFGQIQAVTNFSRDWATMKFAIRLDREADVERARKTIKRVGQEMLADPETAPEFIQPLKMQGIQEITDSAIVVRCKFTSTPAKPTWLQREALKRIHRALMEAGVPFASNAVSFRAGDAARDPSRDGAAASLQATAPAVAPASA
jgi:moderate conductance mechanosensitive channel